MAEEEEERWGEEEWPNITAEIHGLKRGEVGRGGGGGQCYIMLQRLMVRGQGASWMGSNKR